MQVLIRRAAGADIPALLLLLRQIAELHRAVRPDLFRPDASKYTKKELSRILKDPARPVFVAVNAETGEVWGYVFCVIQDYSAERLLTAHKTLFIDDFCIDAAVRGRGTGRALFEHVRRYAEGIACHNITLNVWEFNKGALAFYEKLGMTVQKRGMEFIL